MRILATIIQVTSLVFQVKVQRFLSSRRALSTVVTTLIILVISVLLASTVSYFAINVTSTRHEEESIILSQRHVWFNCASGHSQAAILLMNNGGIDVVVQKATVRGQTVNWSRTYYYTGEFTLNSKIAYIENIAEGILTPVNDGFGAYKPLWLHRAICHFEAANPCLST